MCDINQNPISNAAFIIFHISRSKEITPGDIIDHLSNIMNSLITEFIIDWDTNPIAVNIFRSTIHYVLQFINNFNQDIIFSNMSLNVAITTLNYILDITQPLPIEPIIRRDEKKFHNGILVE